MSVPLPHHGSDSTERLRCELLADDAHKCYRHFRAMRLTFDTVEMRSRSTVLLYKLLCLVTDALKIKKRLSICFLLSGLQPYHSTGMDGRLKTS